MVRRRPGSSLVAVVGIAVALVAVGAGRAQPGDPEPAPEQMAGSAWPQPAAGRSASGDPELILTFDDGPSPFTTGRVLDILDRYQVKAVFFVQGWRFTRGDPITTGALVMRMVRDGHVLGNHTIDHARLCTIDEALRTHQILGARAILERVAHMPVPWFRAPYGERCPALEAELGRLGLRHFHWDIDPQEWRNRGPRFTAAKVIEKLRYLRERAVLIMHDTKEATTIALPAVLDWIAAENKRRLAHGGRPIRILSPTVLAEDEVAPAVAWLTRLAVTTAADLHEGLRATVPARDDRAW